MEDLKKDELEVKVEVTSVADNKEEIVEDKKEIVETVPETTGGSDDTNETSGDSISLSNGKMFEELAKSKEEGVYNTDKEESVLQQVDSDIQKMEDDRGNNTDAGSDYLDLKETNGEVPNGGINTVENPVDTVIREKIKEREDFTEEKGATSFIDKGENPQAYTKYENVSGTENDPLTAGKELSNSATIIGDSDVKATMTTCAPKELVETTNVSVDKTEDSSTLTNGEVAIVTTTETEGEEGTEIKDTEEVIDDIRKEEENEEIPENKDDEENKKDDDEESFEDGEDEDPFPKENDDDEKEEKKEEEKIENTTDELKEEEEDLEKIEEKEEDKKNDEEEEIDEKSFDEVPNETDDEEKTETNGDIGNGEEIKETIKAEIPVKDDEIEFHDDDIEAIFKKEDIELTIDGDSALDGSSEVSNQNTPGNKEMTMTGTDGETGRPTTAPLQIALEDTELAEIIGGLDRLEIPQDNVGTMNGEYPIIDGENNTTGTNQNSDTSSDFTADNEIENDEEEEIE